MAQTKMIDVFNQNKRQIRCVANEHDYLGNGQLVHEDDLEVNKLYTMMRGEVMSYGSMVHLLEIPSEYGFQSYLFEELISYEDKQLKKKYSEWLKNALDEAEKDIQEEESCY